MKRIAVFCASSKGNDSIYTQKAYKLGQYIANKGYGLVYGGASIGCMGAVAQGAIDANGEVIGVLPHFLNKREIAASHLKDLIMVESMHERKLKMCELSDGSITIPGGFGTFEEFFEMATWGQLGLHQNPSALLNINGYYTHLIAQMKHMVTEGLLKQKHFDNLIIETSIANTLKKMENFKAPVLDQWLTPKTT